MKAHKTEVSEVEAAIARNSGYYLHETDPDKKERFRQNILTLQAKLKELCPWKFRRAKLKAA